MNNTEQSVCETCEPGTEPNDARSVCLPCPGNSFSSFGIECQPCVTGTATSDDRTQCEQIVQGEALTSPAVLDQILNGTEFLRPTTSLEFEVSDDVLVDGSEAQTAFFENAAAELATALGVDVSEISVLSIWQPSHDNGRRRVQTSTAQIQFEIAPAVSSHAMSELTSQLADPESPLRQSPTLQGVNPEVAPDFNVICPAGKYLPPGAADCESCPSGQRLMDGQCQDCVAALGQEPNEIGDDCQCMPNYYNTSVWGPGKNLSSHLVIFASLERSCFSRFTVFAVACFAGDFTPLPSSMPICSPCDELASCVSACSGGGITVHDGWSAVVQRTGSSLNVVNSDGSEKVVRLNPLLVFECAQSEACLGGVAPRTRCRDGHRGDLCGECYDDWTNKVGICEECGAATWVTGLMVVLFAVVVIVMAMNINKWYGATSTVQEIRQLATDFNIPELSKVWVATMQILGALPRVLALTLPASFREFLGAITGLFQFDISLFGIGCVTRGLYFPTLMANLLIVVGILGFVVFFYFWELRKARNSFTRERLQELYKEFDPSSKGITADILAELIKEMDPKAPSGASDELFTAAGKDVEGTMSVEEFIGAVTGESVSGDVAVGSENKKPKKKTENGGLAERALQAKIQQANAEAIGRTFLLIFLVYPAVTSKIFEAFHCREIGPGVEVLIVDHTIECQAGGEITVEYAAISGLASILVLAWPVGMPALLGFFLWRSKEKIHANDEDTLKLFDFVIGSYTQKHWYWELVELARKLVLAGLVGLLGRGTVAQMVIAQLVAFFFFALQFRAQPFAVPMLNSVKAFSEFIIFGVLLVSTVMQVDVTDFATEKISIDGYGIAQTGLCIALLPVTAYFMCAHIRELGSEASDLLGDDVLKRESNIFDPETMNPLNEDSMAVASAGETNGVSS
eukprot:SAG31_NODE_1197_length_9441_cov_5.823592_2_plen_916_part_00